LEKGVLGGHMQRREFIALFGGTVAAWPLAAKAQQPTMPLIGFLSSTSKSTAAEQQSKFHSGLGEAGFVQGKNVATVYHWADGQYDRLPAMAADLVRRPVSLIVAQGPPAARAATTTIPIVFVVGFDTIAGGLVDSFNRPGGNATGMTLLTGPLGQKRIEQLRELVPKAAVVAMLANPVSPDAVPEIRDVQIAAQANSLELKMYNASTRTELDAAFSAIAAQLPDALLVGSDPFYVVRRDDFVAFAARYKIPAIYPFREFADAGGLVSYGTNIATAYRQAGIYAGQILKGAKPSELPVVRPTKFELVINLRTAKTLGIDIPPTLHVRSDDVIE
ncbi:MAG: ABC transporter substrate-binding protein, partial [Pseudolabrys sp.]